ncbi:hypothetical protein [Acidimangrovimonas pyrenivorans]|uniref:Uncharacterized protein n=1 Tax=Acidimangrovimonas pyrenivorans TaxID=2030798 RepID=A0ABV7ABM0_9RHOB
MFTIGWLAALTFGWIAVAAPADEPQMMLALEVLFAAIGAAIGMWSWLRIRRGC